MSESERDVPRKATLLFFLTAVYACRRATAWPRLAKLQSCEPSR